MTFVDTPASFDATAFAPAAARRAAPGTAGKLGLFGLDIVNAETDAVIDALLTAQTPQRVAFLNAHCANVAAKDDSYRAALESADMLLPDGIGVELAARMTGQTLTENLNGTDFTPRLLARAAQAGLSVYLLGGRPGVAQEAADKLCLKLPGLRVVGTRDGYDQMADEDAAISEINASGADIVIVAMGVPKQDVWLAANADRLNAQITMGVGALLDFLAGRVRRAPQIVRRAKSEWVWRLAMEPRRMANRYLVGNVAFLARAAAYAISHADTRDATARVFDIVIAGIVLLLLSPLLLATWAAIRLESRGPAMFTQTRIGKDGTPFTIFKFRSMHVDAEERRAAVLALSDREGICFKSRHDPRITRVGRVLRRFSIDELPQIFNVLRGDMSIVGPRPALPQEVAAYPARALGRLAVKPGLTGIWQVSGRAEIGFDKMIDMDLAYIRSRSLLLNFVLLALTARAVLGGRGAY